MYTHMAEICKSGKIVVDIDTIVALSIHEDEVSDNK